MVGDACQRDPQGGGQQSSPMRNAAETEDLKWESEVPLGMHIECGLSDVLSFTNQDSGSNCLSLVVSENGEGSNARHALHDRQSGETPCWGTCGVEVSRIESVHAVSRDVLRQFLHQFDVVFSGELGCGGGPGIG